ncbi:apovitellenin-1-like [Rhineura floridana]|uniref:apovitellenin-1-like n=1 Tax=Rhineura floridana TaxID=261503 RepID=UPI002AC8263B|nr:apovitellenin-1-like [Rhineura floridana]
MLQSKALALTLILFLGSTLTDVGAKAISKRHIRRDWLVIPDAIAYYVYESVNKVFPKAAEVLAEAVQTPMILETRNFLIQKTAMISLLVEQLTENVSSLWQKGENEPAQQ